MFLLRPFRNGQFPICLSEREDFFLTSLWDLGRARGDKTQGEPLKTAPAWGFTLRLGHNELKKNDPLQFSFFYTSTGAHRSFCSRFLLQQAVISVSICIPNLPYVLYRLGFLRFVLHDWPPQPAHWCRQVKECCLWDVYCLSDLGSLNSWH